MARMTFNRSGRKKQSLSEGADCSWSGEWYSKSVIARSSRAIQNDTINVIPGLPAVGRKPEATRNLIHYRDYKTQDFSLPSK